MATAGRHRSPTALLLETIAHPENAMFHWLRERARTRRVGRALYDAIVAQSRAEWFYLDLGVADTLEGRFEVIVLHMFLVMDRLQAEGEPGQAAAQALVERFVTDMDDTMREMGISDLGVPRRVKRAAAALYERAGAYREAMRTGARGEALAEALAKHVYGAGCGSAALPAQLAAYAWSARQELQDQGFGEVSEGLVTFPHVGQGAAVTEAPRMGSMGQ